MAKFKNISEELQEKLKEIKSWMFCGDQKEVGKRARIAETTVSSMFNGHMTPSKKFMDAAIEVMNENKARFEIKPKMKVA